MGSVTNVTYRTRKVDLSDSSSPVPGEENDMLAYIYGIVGPSIVTFGLIGNILILIVVKRSSMAGRLISSFDPLNCTVIERTLRMSLWRMPHKWYAIYPK